MTPIDLPRSPTVSDLADVSGIARKDPLSLARAAVEAGAPFGSVFELLDTDEDREALKLWFVTTPGVPVNPWRPPASAPQQTGNACERCGGLMVRTGTCETCQGCGASSGGCG